MRTAALLLQQFGDVPAARVGGVAPAAGEVARTRLGALLLTQYAAAMPAANVGRIAFQLKGAGRALSASRAAWYRELVFSRPDLPAASE